MIVASVLVLGCSTSIRTEGPEDLHESEERLLSQKRLVAPVEIQPRTVRIGNGSGSIGSAIDLSKGEASALALYRNPATRESVKDFFVSLTGSEEVALTTLYYSDRYGINPFLVFSLMYTESRYKVSAINLNRTSVDRGLFQLNSATFPELTLDDFFNVDVNVRMGMQHLEWCLKQAKGNEERALAIYNAGFGRISSGYVPASTKAYVRNIKSYKSRLVVRFRDHMGNFFVGGTGASPVDNALLL